jgi:hypothetical protein
MLLDMVLPPDGSAPPEQVPAGYVLVHNGRPVTQRQGEGGFRWWFQPTRNRYPLRDRCSCRWAPQVEVHYEEGELQAEKEITPDPRWLAEMERQAAVREWAPWLRQEPEPEAE